MQANELIFRASLAVVSLSLALIRVRYGWQAVRSGEKVVLRRADKVRTMLVWAFGVLAAAASTLWIIAPAWLAGAAISLPTGLRVIGVGLGIVTILLFLWVHRALGKNWAMPGEIKEHHTLITDGPYSWVRHPMYSTLFVWTLAYVLISANALIGLSWLGLSLVAAVMAGDEEAALVETFGEAYHGYRQHVGQFWPRLD